MSDLSPADREKAIQTVLAENKAPLPYGMNMPVLPADFFTKSYHYEYTDDAGVTHKEQLDPLSAAATVVMLKEQFFDLKTDINALNSTAAALKSKAADLQAPSALVAAFANADSMFQQMYATWGEFGKDQIVKLQNQVNYLRGVLLGGTPDNPKGNINNVAMALEEEANTLNVTAAKQVDTEEKALQYFNLHADKYVNESSTVYPTQK
jgi:hypothetical protein